MSKTPETDAEFANMVEATNSPAAKRIAQLERERDEAREMLAAILKNKHGVDIKFIDDHE